MIDYAKLPKKNFLYKVSGLSRGVAAILIPKDRPKPVSVTGIGGLRMIENYFSESEDRHIMRFDGTSGSGPATARVTYEGGGVESFNIKNLAGRTDYAPGPWKGSQSSAPPVKPPVVAPAVQAIALPPEYAAKVGLVAIVQGRVFTPCTRDATNPALWTHPGKKASKYGLRWNVRPGGSVATFNGGSRGLWSVYNGKRFFTLAEIIAEMLSGQVQPPPATPPVVVSPAPAPVKPPEPAPTPTPAKDAELTATGLRLAPDLVPLVAKIIIIEDAETNRTNPPKHLCAYLGNGIWGTGKPLSAFRAAVYQIFWKVEPPARIPHHQGFPGAIKNVSHVMPSGAWNPPTTRNP